MASGKLSPRQKMINMMYLVLTAMLALNVSKDILEALTELNSSLEETVNTVESKNQDIYSAFDRAAGENPAKAGKWKDQAYEVKAKSDDLSQYIEKLKTDLVEMSGGTEENEEGEMVPRRLDAREGPANYLLNQGNAEELKKKLNNYTAEMKQYVDDEVMRKTISKTFDTSPQPDGDKEIPWENAKFEHYPLGAILPFLTDLQAKVRTTESDVISVLQNNIGEQDLKFTGVRVMVDAESNYVTQGGEYEAKVFLAAYDDTQEPTVIIEGEELPEDQIQNGMGVVKFKADQVGEVTWGGKIKIKQLGKEEKVYDIPQTSFTVAPQSVVISPTKMNVLYRGVDNPLEIGVPGVDPSKLVVNGPGVNKVGTGEYMANVTNVSGKEVTINVSVQEEGEDGEMKTRPAGSKQFRIKGLPPAVGMIYKQTTSMRSKSAVKAATVEAAYQDFPFELPLTVTSFEIAIPGFPPERVNGNTLPSDVKTKIDQLKPGSTITIRNIKARGPKGVKVERVGNISVDVQA